MVHLGMDCCFGFVSDISTFSWINFLREWQTLVSGFLALIAAIIAATLLHKQILTQVRQFERQKSREDQADRRKVNASRAQFPHALDELAEYLKECFYYLFLQRPDLPELPKDIILLLNNSIQHIDEKSAEALIRLSVMLQIHRARIKDRAILDNLQQRKQRIYEIAVIYTFVGNMFECARGNKEVPNIPSFSLSRSMLMGAFNVLTYYTNYSITMHSDYPEIEGYMATCPLTIIGD